MLIGYIIIISFIFGDLNSSPSFLHSKLPWVRPHLRRRQSCWPTNPSWSRLNLVFPTSRRRCSSLSVRNGLRTAPLQVQVGCAVDADLRRVDTVQWSSQFKQLLQWWQTSTWIYSLRPFLIHLQWEWGKSLQKSVTSQIGVLKGSSLTPSWLPSFCPHFLLCSGAKCRTWCARALQTQRTPASPRRHQSRINLLILDGWALQLFKPVQDDLERMLGWKIRNHPTF